MKETRSMFVINGNVYNTKYIPGAQAFGRYNIYRMLRDGETPRNHWGDQDGKILITEVALIDNPGNVAEITHASPKDSFIHKLSKKPELSKI